MAGVVKEATEIRLGLQLDFVKILSRYGTADDLGNSLGHAGKQLIDRGGCVERIEGENDACLVVSDF